MAYIVDVPKLRLGEEKVFTMGDRIDLSSGIASKLLSKGYIKFETDPRKIISATDSRLEKLIPDGNVEKVQEYISGIEDIELLREMVLEEEAGKKRKTVIGALKERIQEILDKEETSEDGSDPEIKFNPEEVIDNG